MESIEQPFDSITRIGQDVPDTNDKAGLIDTDGRHKTIHNGDSPRAESSPLHENKATNSLLYGHQNKGLRIIILSLVVFAVAVTVALILTIYLEPKQVHGHAAVSSTDIRCSERGLQVLKDGGNAVDAAVTTAFCMCVVKPATSGIGGGGFAIVHDHKVKDSWGYNFREVAPAAFKPDMLKIQDVEKTIFSVGVPGYVKGLQEMHEKHGKLQWSDLLQPAVELAEDGFTVSEALVHIFDQSDPRNFQTSELKNFLDRNGNFKTINDTIRLPFLAASLKRIQDDPNRLYNGDLMRDFVSDSEGQITEEDMRSYTVHKPTVLESKFKELTVLGLPPPASGAVLGLILNMIDKLGWKDKQANDSLMYHQLIETFKLAFAQWSLLGDPEFHPNMSAVTEYLISDAFAQELVKKMDNQTYNDPSHYGPFVPTNFAGTEHISVVDSSELMVSASFSLNHPWGSGKMLPKTGILLNNNLMDFDGTIGSANSPSPGKQPLSSMSPTVLFNEEHPCAHRIIIGAAGGMRIETSIAQTIVNNVIFNMNISSSISAPRVHNQLSPMTTFYDKGIPAQVIKDLEVRGHKLEMNPPDEPTFGVTAIEKTNDNIRANSDFREFGGVAKY